MDAVMASGIGFAMSQALLGGVLLVSSRPWHLKHTLYGLLQLAIILYLLEPLHDGWWWGFIFGSLSAAVPGMFWLFSATLFDDRFRLQFWHVGLVAFTVLLPLAGRALHLSSGDTGYIWLFTVPQGVEFLLLGFALFAVARHWNGDLVEERRSLRTWFCALNGGHLVAFLLIRELLFPGESWWSSIQYMSVGAMLLVTNALLLRYRETPWAMAPLSEAPSAVLGAAGIKTGLEPGPVEEPDAVVVPVVDQALLDQLNRLMEEELAYQEMGLTIGKLAERLELPEYKLRQLINAELGYRNFNDFLNRYRIKETSARLADAEQSEIQVLVIALDAGFRSISSFNKAFKETHGCTPTAYRNEQAQTLTGGDLSD
jgi:AraC-like DNA-binding protein